MAFAWPCCLAVFLQVMGLLLDLAGTEGTHLERRVLLEIALGVAVKAAPAVTIAVAAAAAAAAVVVAADSEKIVAQVGMGLLEMVLVVEPRVGVFDIVDRMVNTDSVGAGAQLDLAEGWVACNKEAVEGLESHLVREPEPEPEPGVLEAAAEGLFDEAEQEPTAGCLHQMHCQFF